MTYAILGIEKGKTYADIGTRAAHNLRTTPEAAPRADRKKRNLNRVLKGGTTPGAVTEAFKSRIESLPKARKDAVKCVELVLTASPEFFDQTRPGALAEIKGWFTATRKWLRTTFGEANIISEALHRDEKTPHIQVLITPVHDGKLRAAHWFDGKQKMEALHTSYAEALQAAGTRLRRGEQGSKAKHTHLKDFYRLTRQIVEAARSEEPIPLPKMPKRGILGHVTSDDWEKLQKEMKDYGEEGARMRAEAVVGRYMAGIAIGAESAQVRADLAKRRQEEAEAALREVESRVGVAKANLAKLTKSIKDKEAELVQHEAAIASAIERRRATQAAADAIERRAGVNRPAPSQVKREGR